MDKKNSHSAILSQVLAQFDIETKVRKVATQVFQKILLNNQNAFSFMEECGNKFTNLQLKINHAENKTLEASNLIIQKLEIVEQLRQKLKNLDQRLWSNNKENLQQLGKHKRKIDDLASQKKQQGLQIKENFRQITEVKTQINELSLNLNTQIVKMLEKINNEHLQTNQSIAERKQEIQKLIEAVLKSKALLDSKTQIVETLIKDVTLYKSEKQIINKQIQNLYSQNSDRVVKSEFYAVRKHFDGIIQNQKQRYRNRFVEINEQISSLKKDQIEKDDKIIMSIQELKTISDQKDLKLQQLIDQKYRQNADTITIIKDKIQLVLKQHNERLQKNKKDIQSILTFDQNIQKVVTRIEATVEDHHIKIDDNTENILSFNQSLRKIQQENISLYQAINQAKEQKNSQSLKLQIPAAGYVPHVDNSKLIEIKNQIVELKNQMQKREQKREQKYVQNYSSQERAFSQFVEEVKNMNNNMQQRLRKLQNNNQKIEIKLQYMENNTKTLIKQCEDKSIGYTKQIINSIRKQLENLNTISNAMTSFQQLFQIKIKQNQVLNAEVKQNVQKIFNNFTKLKSDVHIRIDNLNSDFNKKSSLIKQHQRHMDHIRSYLSELSQIISICLCLFTANEHIQSKDHEPIKISSIMEGWVIQLEENQRIKYRGQYILKHKLLQMTLDYYIKIGDKIKGGLIESGKNIYAKICQNNPEFSIKLRKRALSKRRQSQLPKVYK